MKYTVEENLSDFKFWSGAEDRVKYLTSSELDSLDDILPDLLGEEPTDTDINDTFWFEFPTVCHLLGYACVDDEPIREPGDFDEDFRLDFLREYADGEDWKYTEDQLKALDKKLLDDGTYELDAENDTLEDLPYIKDDAQEVGIITDEDFYIRNYSDEARREVLKKYLDEMEYKYTDKQVADLDELLLNKGNEYFVDDDEGLSLPYVEDSLLKQVGITEEE